VPVERQPKLTVKHRCCIDCENELLSVSIFMEDIARRR
jgi:hypothetical protein